MNEQLKALYQSVILKHDRSPFHFEKKEHATHKFKAYNEICGDRFEVFFEMEYGKIKDAAFHGFGCAISKASTSVLVKKIIGQTPDEAKKLIAVFIDNVTGNEHSTKISDDELTAFFAARDFPGRQKCATLAWDEMKKWLEEKTHAF